MSSGVHECRHYPPFTAGFPVSGTRKLILLSRVCCTQVPYNTASTREVERLAQGHTTNKRDEDKKKKKSEFKTSFLARKQSCCMCLARFRITARYQDLGRQPGNR